MCFFLSFYSYVYKCVCQQHSELLYKDLTQKIITHLNQVSSRLEVRNKYLHRERAKCIGIYDSIINHEFMSTPWPPPPGKSTWGLHRELQSCLEPIHCISTMYSSSIHVHGMYHFKQITLGYIQWYPLSIIFLLLLNIQCSGFINICTAICRRSIEQFTIILSHVTLSEQVLHWGKVKQGPWRGADEVVRRLRCRETREDPDAWVLA